jgi:hypothetical protein
MTDGPRACLPLLLHQLAKTGQDKFAVLLGILSNTYGLIS